MSFKIFSLQLTGKIKSVDLIEKKRKALLADYSVCQSVKDSDELKKFLELKELLGSEEFKKNKKAVLALSYKGSEEENQQKEFNGLKKQSRIKKYFAVKGSMDLEKFQKEKDGSKMKEYYGLLEYVKEGQFESDKKEIKSQVFKGSVEEKHLKDFKRLEKSAAIRAYLELEASGKLKKHKATEETDKFKRFNELKNTGVFDKEKQKELKALQKDLAIKEYFKFEKSKKLKLYHEAAGSHDLQKYYELKEFTVTEAFKKQEAFLKDKKKFEKSEAFQKQQNFKQLESDSTVKFVLKFEKSKLYKNYLDVKDSFDLKRYAELEELLQSDEYKQKKAWLEDKKRWEKTEEFKKEQQYEKEKVKPEFVCYFKYQDSNEFDFFNNWETVFEDDFSAKELDTSKWQTCTSVAKKLLGSNYALPGDLSIATEGNNLILSNNLTIQVKKEKTAAKIWKMPAGFIPAELEYSTGFVTSGDNFNMEDGILEAKITFNPVKNVASSFYLAGDEATPRINLVEMGVKNNLGVSTVNANGKIENDGLDISNLKKGKYIFTLEKSGADFTWKINETEVLKQSHAALNKALSLNAGSMVIQALAGSSGFEVEWVKCYKKK